MADHLTLTFVIRNPKNYNPSDLDFYEAYKFVTDNNTIFFAAEDGVTDHAVSLGADPHGDLVEQSINEFCSGLPQQRYSHEAKGKRLLFSRTGLVMVPYSQVNGGWNCVVVKGNKTYPVGGYDLFVSDIEIMTALEVE